MNSNEDSRRTGEELLESYAKTRVPSEMPEGFIDRVRATTRIRRKQRHQRHAIASSVFAILVVGAIFFGSNRMELFETADPMAEQMLFEVTDVETYVLEKGVNTNELAGSLIEEDQAWMYELYAEKNLAWSDTDFLAALDDETINDVLAGMQEIEILGS